jgi:cytochrome c oxidase assembly protein subunit 20
MITIVLLLIYLLQGLIILGRDVSEIPCFRSSFLYGMGGGFLGGIGAFLRTSRPQFSTHIGMASFFTTTFGYWFLCR